MKMIVTLLLVFVMTCGLTFAESSLDVSQLSPEEIEALQEQLDALQKETADTPQTALQILTAMIDAGASINPDSLTDYTEETDPNGQMGEPGAYTSKTDFGYIGYAKDKAENWVGGTLEVFDDVSHAKARFDYLSSIYTSWPNMLNCYVYLRDRAVLRIDSALENDEVSEVLTAFESVVNGETEIFSGIPETEETGTPDDIAEFSTASADTDHIENQPEQLQEWIDVAHEVQYIGHRDVAHITPDNVQRIWFALMDENENQLASPAVVDIEIVNDNGEVVYDRRHYIDPSDYGTWTNSLTNSQNLLCSIDVPDEDILPGSAKTGIININVFYSTMPEYGITFAVFSFPEYSDDVDNLPYNSPATTSALEILEIPETVSYMIYDQLSYTLAIEDVSYEFSDSNELGKVDLTIYITGKKEFDSEGDNHSNECRIGIKLYQEEYVIESGTILTTNIAEGEGFRNASVTYRGLEPGSYQLKILDVES